MTDQPFQPPQPAEPEPRVVDAGTDTELAALLELYPDLKAASDEAAARFDVVKQAIKVKLTALDPTARKFALTGEGGPRLTVSYSESRRFDSKRFRREQPQAYDAYLGAPSGSWSIREA